MESFFQIILALCRAHSAHRCSVFGPDEKVFPDLYSRSARCAFCQESGLIITSFSHPCLGTGHGDQHFGPVLFPCFFQKAFQRLCQNIAVIVCIFSPLLIFEAVERTGNASVPEGGRSRIEHVRLPAAVLAVFLLGRHRFTAFAAGEIPDRLRDIRTFWADQLSVRLHRSVTDRASPGKKQVCHRRRRLQISHVFSP